LRGEVESLLRAAGRPGAGEFIDDVIAAAARDLMMDESDRLR
jgi:hypothetical protein